MQMLEKFLDISHSRDYETFRRRLISFAHHMDFPLVSAVLMGNYAHATTEYCPYIGNRPDDFLGESFDGKKQAIDPVLTRLRQQRAPFGYDQKFYVDGGAPELWEIAAPWGFRSGICLSLQLSEKSIFLLGIDRERDLPKDERKVERLFTDLRLFATFAFDAAERLLGPYQGNRILQLSRREREILLRILQGKSNWVIAQLLNVSENTIKFHLKNIFQKMGVSSRIVAATKAHSLGLLTDPPACSVGP
jgi:DNA-binding CsgD family transcriptional regulator